MQIYLLGAATRNVKVAHDNKFGDNKCGRDSGDC